MRKLFPYLLISLAYAIGLGSLIAFAVFSYAGSFQLIRLGLGERASLLLDACLSLLFFLQHSGMVRKPFRRYLARFIPEVYIGAVYTIFSGIILLAIMIIWQGTSSTVAIASDVFRLFLRVLFVLSIVGFYWGTKSLGFFDPLGVRVIQRHLRRRPSKEMPLAIKGPYRWVRHPLYLFVLVMIWSCPDLTSDRLMLNILWTVWIFIGTLLEERDLMVDFGEQYRQYRHTVPMLIPWRLFLY